VKGAVDFASGRVGGPATFLPRAAGGEKKFLAFDGIVAGRRNERGSPL
jgi:hypothetical protein